MQTMQDNMQGVSTNRSFVAQIYAEKAAERARELKQQHSQCAHTLRRRAANAEPYAQVQTDTCFGSRVVLPYPHGQETLSLQSTQSKCKKCNECAAHSGQR